MREFECGDKVQIRRDLHEAEDWCGKSISVPARMAKCAGKWATVTKKLPRAVLDGVIYLLDIDGGRWHWHESMFELDPKEQGTEIKETPKDDAVSHPSHYTDGKIEVIDFIQDKRLDFARGNVVKYISRAGKKGGSKEKELEDLRKARQYCDFAIREREGRK